MKYGSATKPMPGYSVSVVDDAGEKVEKTEIGNIVIKLPLPPGCLPTLWNDDAGFESSYLSEFPGYYKTADAGFEDEDGYFWIDDAHRRHHQRRRAPVYRRARWKRSSPSHPDVAECAVVGVRDALKGQVPFGFLVLKSGVSRESSEVTGEVVALLSASGLARLPPLTGDDRRSPSENAIREGAARDHALDCRRPACTRCRRRFDDPAILDEIKDALRRCGYGVT